MSKRKPKATAKTFPKNTSIALDERSQAFIREQVDAGEYASASELMRDALRRLEAEKKKENAFYAALRRGIESPLAPPGTFERVRAKYPRGKTSSQ